MKMPLKRNLLENITIIANSGTILCILLHYLTDISLLAGKWFLLYILTVFIFSVFFSFRVIQWLLHLNKPICYDLDAIVAKYPYLARLRGFLPELPKPAKVEWKEYDTNELSVISTVLERKLVSSWYVPYISQEIGFPFACKQMLDQMIGRAFQICSNIETKDVFVDTSTVLISHLKEYEKAVKRHEKSPSSSIESLYKKSHSISDPDKNYTSVDHCTNILRLMIKELLPWELRDTPHSELLVRILSKKLDSFINSTLADPAWLNDKLMTYLTGEEYIEFKKEEPKEPTKTDEEVKKDEREKESLETKREIEEQKIEESIVIKEECQGKTESVAEVHPVGEMKDVKSSPVLRQKRGRQGRSEVKIYDRIIEGSTKTWETDMDLQCISLGQDLLASLDGEITLSRLWGQEDLDQSPDAGGKSPHQHAAVLEELSEPEYHSSPRHSPKPLPLTAPGSKPPTEKGAQILTSGGAQHLTSGGAQHLAGGPPTVPAEALLALQASVSHAKHKIGDLQVNDIDVAGASDEAAGMMEGLLDFGIAGLKKGLRFTGLSDDSQEKCPSHVKERADKSPPLEWSRPHLSDQEIKGEENGNGIPHLVKQQRVTSQDSMPSQPRAIPPPACESPEPQYEEAADLSTSIAKLRRLLRQRAEAAPAPNNRGGEVWWEGAEETRGRTTHHQSTRPVDAATLADEYDMSLERNSPNQSSNNMQRLDKLFHRTVTGVFNSIKTAVGADEAAPPHAQQWAYVHTSNELSVCVVAARLAWARRGRGVEAALDSLTLHAAPPPPPPPEDLDEWLAVQGRAWSAASGLAVALHSHLHSHVAHRLATSLLADSCECIFACWLQSLAAWLRAQLFHTFSRMEEGAPVHTDTKRPLDVDHTARVILDKLPALSVLFGSDTVTASVRRAVRSASHGAVNRDVVYRVLDLWALHFKQAAGVRNPSFDAN